MYRTTDLCDAHSDTLQIVEPIFRDYGGRTLFHGPIATVKTYEDNSRVRERVAEPGEGRVLVVDGGASTRCALLGDLLAAKAVENGWAGIVVYGCIRDSVEIGTMDLGVKALSVYPLKSVKRGLGDNDVSVRFAGVDFVPGHYLYADPDGIIVSPDPLPGPEGD